MDAHSLKPLKTPSAVVIISGTILAMLIPLVLSIGIVQMNITYYDMVLYSRFFYWATVSFLFFYAYKVEHQPLLILRGAKFEVGTFIVAVVVLYLLFIAAAIISAIPTFLGLHENKEVM